MALISCADCGRQVSDRAAACPQCGGPIEKKVAPVAVRQDAKPEHPSAPPVPTVDPIETTARMLKRRPSGDPDVPKECVVCHKDTSNDLYRRKEETGGYTCLECQEGQWDREVRRLHAARTALRRLLAALAFVAICVAAIAGVIELTGKGAPAPAKVLRK